MLKVFNFCLSVYMLTAQHVETKKFRKMSYFLSRNEINGCFGREDESQNI